MSIVTTYLEQEEAVGLAVTPDTDRMDPEIKARWITAMESGDFIHGRLRLSSMNIEGVRTYCCLGVLSVLYLQSQNTETTEPQSIASRFPESNYFLPPEVREWAKIPLVYLDSDGKSIVLGGKLLHYVNDSTDSYENAIRYIKEFL